MFLILISLIASANADLLLDMYKEVIDYSVDPCDNFYRHACRLGIDRTKSVEYRFLNALQNRSDPFVKTVLSEWNSSIMADFFVLENSLNTDVLEDQIEKQYKSWCENKNVKAMKYFWFNIFHRERPRNIGNCSTEIEIVKKLTGQSNIDSFIVGKALLALFAHFVNSGFEKIQLENTYISRTFEEMRTLTLAWLQETPWAVRHEVIERYKEAIDEMSVQHIYQNGKKFVEELKQFDKFYSNCNERLNSTTVDSKLICFIASVASDPVADLRSPFSNAMNLNQENIVFGPLYYYLSSTYLIEAANIGFVAQTVGHEFGHTIFDNNRRPSYGYFSKDVSECILQQFNSTCNTYKEDYCASNKNYLEENGADIIGQRLAYEILKQKLGSKLHEVIPGTNSTNQQLYFYGYAFHSCEGRLSNDDGVHSASNVRINTIAQMPEFQEAFNCPADSRMMKSKTKECVVYGPQAPETKRKFATGKKHLINAFIVKN